MSALTLESWHPACLKNQCRGRGLKQNATWQGPLACNSAGPYIETPSVERGLTPACLVGCRVLVKTDTLPSGAVQCLRKLVMVKQRGWTPAKLPTLGERLGSRTLAQFSGARGLDEFG